MARDLRPSDLSASFRALYDDTNLYVLVDVTDDSLVNDSLHWYDDDCVEIMIDGDYSRGASYDGVNDFELGFRWNDLTITAGANSAPVPAGAKFRSWGPMRGTGWRSSCRWPSSASRRATAGCSAWTFMWTTTTMAAQAMPRWPGGPRTTSWQYPYGSRGRPA